MSSPTVREQPNSRNFFTLDGERSPGIALIDSGGDAEEEIQDQRQPLTTGANSVVQFSKNAVIVYRLRLWEIGHLQTWDRWEAMLLAGRSRRPPRVYALVDARARWLKRVIFQKASPEGIDRPGGPWWRILTLHQYNRVAPYGGPIKPGVFDAAITEQNAANAAKQAQLDALSKPLGSMPPGKKP